MSILVCGGAGYIGSHNVRLLQSRGEEPVVLDNLRTGRRCPQACPCMWATCATRPNWTPFLRAIR